MPKACLNSMAIRAACTRFWIITINMENRCHHHLGHIRWIGRRPRIMRACCKADLIVVDDMDRAAGAITAKRGKGKGLSHDALTGKGRVAMQKDANNTGAISIFMLFLLGTNTANHNWIDNLEMRRVWRQTEMDILAIKLTV